LNSKRQCSDYATVLNSIFVHPYKFHDKMSSQNDSVNFAANRRDEVSEGLFLRAPEEQFNWANWRAAAFSIHIRSIRSDHDQFSPCCMECRRGLAMRILSVCLSVTRVHC